MTRERHIYELERLLSFGESMCPASKQYWKEHKDEVLEAVKNTKEGEWIYKDIGIEPIWNCSECGKRIICSQSELPNYCEDCGSRMKGAEDYERAIEQMEYDMIYEPTYNSEDGSM